MIQSLTCVSYLLSHSFPWLLFPGPVISVIAHHKQQATFIGSTFEMSCLAKLKNLWKGVALSVLILVQYDVGSPSRKLASLSPDLVLTLEDWIDPSRQNSLSLVKTGSMEFLFRILNVQMTDRGFYSCEVAAWTKPDKNNWEEMVKGESNKVHINFKLTSKGLINKPWPHEYLKSE